MGNSLRCCLACVLPCGALDLIRIVHMDGYVEEIARPVIAGEILKANPNHVLSKPCSQGVVRKILILSPETELKRGTIYFLVPDTSLLEEKKKKKKKRKDEQRRKKTLPGAVPVNKISSNSDHSLGLCEKYLEDVVLSSAKLCSVAGKEHRHRRKHSRSASVSTWRPHLESITED